MKNSSWRLLAIFMVIGVIGPIPAQAQLLQGSITGNVVDPSSAAVVGAKVVATEQQTNFTRETITNDQGGYNFLTMPPGTYRLTVSAPSFQTTNITGITVSPEQITRRDVSLTVGQVTENVMVSADANVLQADKAEVRDGLNIKSLANVPVPMGRNYQMLFITMPGISPPTNSNSFTANSNRGLNFSVGGGYAGSNSSCSTLSALKAPAKCKWRPSLRRFPPLLCALAI